MVIGLLQAGVLCSSQILCTSVPGVGANLRLYLSVNNWTYLSPPAVTLSYALPVITSISGFVGFSTVGGQVFQILGNNFGPVGTTVNVTFVMVGKTRTYSPVGCAVATAHTVIQCQSPPGVGANHTWTVGVGGQSSIPVVLGTSYLAPIITACVPLLLAAHVVLVVRCSRRPVLRCADSK